MTKRERQQRAAHKARKSKGRLRHAARKRETDVRNAKWFARATVRRHRISMAEAVAMGMLGP